MSILKVYWDSDCFLGWFKNERDKINKCKGTVEKAKKGELKIITSAITLTEVIRLKDKPPLTQQDEKKISGFFKHEYIIIQNLDRKIAEFSRNLMWKHPALKPKDSIHVATAILRKIPILNTFDEGLLSLDNRYGSPPLHICHPDIPWQGQLSFVDTK